MVHDTTLPISPTAAPPDRGRCGCQCSGLCRKFKKIFCLQESYNIGAVPADIEPKIETSAPEYGLKYEHALEVPLGVGSLVLVTATPSDDIPRFAINIGSGDPWSDRSDIALHFNPRMPQRYVVRNSRRGASWGAEETTSYRSFPFKPGREFTVELLVTDGGWLVAVDGQHYCSYAHRQPAASATYVQVTDIASPSVRVVRADVYPRAAQPPPEVPRRDHARAEPAAGEPEWGAHACGLLPGGVPQGDQVVVSGRLRAMPQSFHVELAEAWQEWPHPDVHLHVNPRLVAAPAQPRQLVVLNSWLRGCWGAEQRQATARLLGGMEVQLRLVRGAAEWLVWADDTLLGELPFRADPERVRAVRVRGDLLPRHVYTAPAD